MQIPDEQTVFEESNASKEKENVQKKISKNSAKARPRRRKNSACKNKNEPKTIISQRQSQTRRSIKPTAKTQQGTTIHILVTQLFILLDNWEQNLKVSAFLTFYYDQGQESVNKSLESEENSLYILRTSIQEVNAASLVEFSSLSQFDVKKPETYKRAINKPHTQ